MFMTDHTFIYYVTDHIFYKIWVQVYFHCRIVPYIRNNAVIKGSSNLSRFHRILTDKYHDINVSATLLTPIKTAMIIQPSDTSS